MLRLPLGAYKEFSRKLNDFPERHILMNCCLDQTIEGGSELNMKIPCTTEEAEAFLRLAKMLQPEIAEAIARDIALAREAGPE